MNIKKLLTGIFIIVFALSIFNPVSAAQKKIKKITATRGDKPVVKVEYQDGSILISNFLVPEYEGEEVQQPQTQPQTQNQNSNSVSNLAENLDLNEVSSASSGRYKQILAAEILVENVVKENPNQIVVTPSGEKYHYAKCEDLHVHCKPVTVAEAKSLGYKACGKCKPPEN